MILLASGWAWSWTAIAACATAAAAAVTAWMAYQTHEVAEKTKEAAEAAVHEAEAVEKQARASADQTALTRQSLEISTLPWLTVGESEVRTTTNGQSRRYEPVYLEEDKRNRILFAHVIVRNVGRSLAILHPTDSHFVGWPGPQSVDPKTASEFNSGRVSNPVLSPGEQEVIEFYIDLQRWGTDFATITHEREGFAGNVFFDVVYGSLLKDAELTRVRFSLIASEGSWRVYQIDYFRPVDAGESWPSVHFGAQP